MAAMMRRGNSNKKDSMSGFLNHDDGFRAQQLKRGIQPKNHMKENMRDLKNAQMEMRDRREEESRPAKELYKLSQFKDVAPRLYETSDRLINRRPSMESKEFLARGVSENRRDQLAMESRAARIELDRKMEEAKHFSQAKPVTPRKEAVPREVNELAPHNPTDFVSRNKVKAMTMVPSHSREEGRSRENDARHEDFGRVPEYLEERKARWAEEESEKKRRMPDPNCPRGMCLMPEAERRGTLETLQQSKEEALNQLRRMPFVIETPTQKKRQEMLEAKLREIDSAIQIFSKDKVYVAI